MTKDDFKTKVGMGFFSCKWVNNAGSTSKIKRGILAYRVGNGLLAEHRRWANINPETIIQINGRDV